MRRQILFSSVAPQDAEPETILKKIKLYSLYKEGAVIFDKISTKKVNIFVKIKFVNKLSIIMRCASIVYCLTRTDLNTRAGKIYGDANIWR